MFQSVEMGEVASGSQESWLEELLGRGCVRGGRGSTAQPSSPSGMNACMVRLIACRA